MLPWLLLHRARRKLAAEWLKRRGWRFHVNYLPNRIWLKRQGWRLYVNYMPHRIGHLCLETDALLKECILDGHPYSRLVLRDIGASFANPHVVRYFRDYITITERHPVIEFVDRYGPHPNLIVETSPYAAAMYSTARAFAVYSRWGRRPPLFRLTAEDEAALQDYRRCHSLRPADWFVALHGRGPGYNLADDHHHSYRNVDVGTFGQAIAEIVARGGWVIRMGDATMDPIASQPRVIDYARSAEKSAQLDLALAAGCRFFLGSASGLVNLAQMFGRPAVTVNMAPLAGAYTLGLDDLAIPQRLQDASGRFLPLAEIMTSPVANYRRTGEFTERGLTHVPNTAEEIRAVVLEMLERLEGTFIETEEDVRRQDGFRALFRPGHYAYGAAGRIGRDFLQKHFPLQPAAQ